MEKDQLAQLLEEKDLLQKVQIEKIQNLTRMLVTSSSLTSQQELKVNFKTGQFRLGIQRLGLVFLCVYCTVMHFLSFHTVYSENPEHYVCLPIHQQNLRGSLQILIPCVEVLIQEV